MLTKHVKDVYKCKVSLSIKEINDNEEETINESQRAIGGGTAFDVRPVFGVEQYRAEASREDVPRSEEPTIPSSNKSVFDALSGKYEIGV